MYFANFACISAIGDNAETTLGAIDAQVSGYHAEDYRCQNGNSAIMATIEDGLFYDTLLDIDLTGPITTKMVRCAKMLAFAIQDLKQQVTLNQPATLIWLGSDSSGPQQLSQTFVEEVMQELDAPVDTERLIMVNLGRAAGLYALRKAHELLHEQEHDYVLLGCAESPMDNDWLDSLDARGRLKAEGVVDGFAPGEGAGFLLLARTPELARACQQNSNAPLHTVALHQPGISQSPAHWGNETENKGEALHGAMLKALQSVPENKRICDAIVCSLNGELFWMKEHRVALARLSTEIGEAELYHPFEYCGDLGALSGILLLAQAAHLVQTQQHQSIMVYSSSDNAWRSVAVVQYYES